MVFLLIYSISKDSCRKYFSENFEKNLGILKQNHGRSGGIRLLEHFLFHPIDGVLAKDMSTTAPPITECWNYFAKHIPCINEETSNLRGI